MAHKTHLAKLAKGSEVWNTWRRSKPSVRPDLCGADLAGVDLSRANLDDADLSRSNLSGARLIAADLRGADLTSADLRRTHLRGTYRPNGSYLRGADLSRAHLRGANLEGADLFDVDLQHADLSHANLTHAQLFEANLRDARLSDAHIGNVRLPASIVEAADLSLSLIDWRTVARSIHLAELQTVLERSGMPRIIASYMIDSARSIDATDLFAMMQSVFLAYHPSDEAFARRLRADLQDNGIRNCLVPEATTSAEPSPGPPPFDRMIVMCSKAALSDPGLLQLVMTAVARERTEKTSTILLPIVLDGALFENGPAPSPWWPGDLRAAHGILFQRVGADFREAVDAPHRWGEELGKLLSALRGRSPAA